MKGSKIRPFLPTVFFHSRRASAAVEFAMTSGALLFFMMAILNLGYLGLTVNAMQHGAEAAARAAVVQLAANVATSGAAAACPSGTAITGYFNTYASPPLPAASTTVTTGTPAITATWTNNGTATNTMPPVTYLQLTASYTWKPIGMPSFFRTGIPLNISTLAAAMGTTGITTKC
jgi:Flp pilus assembly protein TadG